MEKRYAGNSGKYVGGFRKDPVKLLTEDLLRNITNRETPFAKMNYSELLDLIHSKGDPGKDIRYVRSQLNEHARYLRSKGADAKAKQAELYARTLPKPANGKRGSNSNSKIVYYDRNLQSGAEMALLREYSPKSAVFIQKRLEESGVLIQIRERGLTLSGLMEHVEFFPGRRSGKLYIVHNHVVNEVAEISEAGIPDPEKFFESERYKDFRHLRLDNITLVLPRDAASRPKKGIGKTPGYQIVPRREVEHFIDDIVRAEPN